MEHNKTHLPYRNWCKSCVRGRGLQLPHNAQDGGDGLPELHMDVCFMGDEDRPGKTIPVLVAKVKESRMKMSAVVLAKSSGRYISRRVLEFPRETGHEQGDIIVKSDQEAAMKVIINEVGRARAAA